MSLHSYDKEFIVKSICIMMIILVSTFCLIELGRGIGQAIESEENRRLEERSGLIEKGCKVWTDERHRGDIWRYSCNGAEDEE